MARKMKGGAGEGGLIVFWGILLVVLVGVVLFLLFGTKKKETFVTAPSATGDQKEVTPSGNVILY